MSTTSKGLELSFRKCAHVADDLTLLTSSHSVLVGVVHFKIIEENLRKDFYVSEALLGEHVPECAETIQTREDADTAVEMSDEATTVDIETFRLFTKWLSAKNLAGFTPFGPLYKHPMGNLDQTSGMPLLKLYIFVTDYNILRLADDAGRRFASFFTIAGGPRRLGVDIDVLPTVSKIALSVSLLRPILLYARSSSRVSVLLETTWISRWVDAPKSFSWTSFSDLQKREIPGRADGDSGCGG
jgi:hypothetical protein